MGKNLAEKFSKVVDERFEQGSKAKAIVSNAYEWTGVETLNVYSFPVAPATDYNPEAEDVYGPAVVLERNVQKMTVGQKKVFNLKVARLDREMDMMATDAGKQLSRQINQVVIPQYDQYVFNTIAGEATKNGNLNKTTPTKSNAYSLFLQGQEFLGDSMAPEKGRVCVCSYAYFNLLKQDPAFVRYGDSSQAMLSKGIIGTVDGVNIMPVASSRLPIGCSAIFTHPYALVAPVKLRDYIIHDNPPGWNGWKIEGLVCYDAFVLNEKADGIYYIGNSGVKRRIMVNTAPASGLNDADKTRINITTPKESTNTWKWAASTAKIENTYGEEPSAGGTWTELTVNGSLVTPGSGNTVITVVELDASGKVVGEGHAKVNMA